MDYVTMFALGTLAAVFLLAAGVLITLCWRRKKQRESLARGESTFVFSKARDEKVSNLIELGPLLDTELEKIDWAEAGVRTAPFDEVLAILRLTTEVVKILSDVSISRAASKIYEVIAQAMFRVDTHFHELLEFTPSEENDIRVIEARALTLTTTVWSLNAAFTLHGFEQAKDVEDRVIKMYEHVDKLRQLIPGYEGRPGGERREGAGGGGEGRQQEEEEEGDSQVTDETVMDAASSGGGGGDAIISHEALPSAAASAAAAAASTTVQQQVEVHVNPEPEDDAATTTPPKAQTPPISNGSPASAPDPATVSPTTPKDTVDTERDPLLLSSTADS